MTTASAVAYACGEHKMLARTSPLCTRGKIEEFLRTLPMTYGRESVGCGDIGEDQAIAFGSLCDRRH